MVTSNTPRMVEPAFDIEDSNAGDIRWCMRRIDKINQEVSAGDLSVVNAQRSLEILARSFEMIRGIPISEASKECLNPIDRLENISLLEMGEKDLDRLEAAIVEVVGLNIQKKNRWLSLISRVRAVQAKARLSAIAMWVYVGRTSEDNSIFKMGPAHQEYFRVWEDDSVNSLIMAPPGHGKTTSFRGLVIWRIANHPNLRILILYDTDDKAQKEVKILAMYLNSGRLRALYPDIYVLDRNDGAENSAKRFTVNRPNVGSREPSIECAGIKSKINGNGYDEIIIDDPCPETVATQPAEREAINNKFDTVVEQRLRDPKNSRVRMICTPWHSEDLAGHIISSVRKGKRDNWRIEVDRFAIKEDENGIPISIWPERYEPKFYINQQRKLTRNNYARLYQLKCMSDEMRIVKALHYYPALGPEDPLWERLSKTSQDQYIERLAEIAKGEIWYSVDPSATAGKYSSNTAVTKFSLTAKGEGYVVDAWEFPGDPLATQDWLVDQIRFGRVDRLLMEAQGGMKGQVVLWTEYILRRLRELGFKWSGSIIDCNTQGKGGGQNVGKTRRLQNTAAYLSNGYVKFPGQLRELELCGKIVFARGVKDSIITLEQQILDFPAGTCDGVDTVTQWLIEVESRLPALNSFQRAEIQQMQDTTDPISRLLRTQVRNLLHPPKRDDPSGEDQWTMDLLGVA